jgi:hypothetical protein
MQKYPLPNANAALVLGIISVFTSFVLLGLVVGIVGIAISTGPRNLYFQNPDKYYNYGVLNAGRVLSIIGVVLSAISVFIGIISIGIFGSFFIWALWM